MTRKYVSDTFDKVTHNGDNSKRIVSRDTLYGNVSINVERVESKGTHANIDTSLNGKLENRCLQRMQLWNDPPTSGGHWSLVIEVIWRLIFWTFVCQLVCDRWLYNMLAPSYWLK